MLFTNLTNNRREIHYMRYHFMLFTNPTNNRRELSIGFKPAVQSFFEIKYCLNKKRIRKNKKANATL